MFLQECLMLEHRTKRGISELRSACSYYFCQKNRYSRDIHEIDPPCNHVKSCDIDFGLRRVFATRSLTSRVDVEPKLDIAQYHMIKLQINLMNFIGCDDFLARVVVLSKSRI